MTPDITRLAPDELEALRLLAAGLTDEEAARQLKTTPYAYRGRVNLAVRKLGFPNATAACLWLHEQGIPGF